MIFGRRERISLLRRIWGYIWPRAGLARAGKYIAYRVGRLPGSAYSISAGLACGAAVSFSPFIGFHFLLGAMIAWLIRGNLIAMALGTVVGNPWTFPFIWSWIFTLGRWIQGEGPDGDLPDTLSMAYIIERPAEILYPMALGSIPSGIVVWVLVFVPCYKAVVRFQEARRRRRERGGRFRRKPASAGAVVQAMDEAAAADKDKGDHQ